MRVFNAMRLLRGIQILLLYVDSPLVGLSDWYLHHKSLPRDSTGDGLHYQAYDFMPPGTPVNDKSKKHIFS